eukprot:8617539-Alexandrium_andersonii.AAC.1
MGGLSFAHTPSGDGKDQVPHSGARYSGSRKLNAAELFVRQSARYGALRRCRYFDAAAPGRSLLRSETDQAPTAQG